MENNIAGKLKIENLCFPYFDFKQNIETKGPVKLNYTFQVAYKKINDKSQIVNIYLKIVGENERIVLNIHEQAIVELVNAELLDDNTKESLLNQNSVAIMFPYLRSQVAIITAQPGLMPIQLPIIDVSQLVKNASYID